MPRRSATPRWASNSPTLIRQCEAAVERRLTYHLDTARSYARKSSVQVRETLRQLMGRAKPAVMPDLRPLLAAASLPD
jgi:hypothetical protein